MPRCSSTAPQFLVMLMAQASWNTIIIGPARANEINNLLIHRKWLGVFIANLQLCPYSDAGIQALIFDPSINVDV
jgi:hypothetical protein